VAGRARPHSSGNAAQQGSGLDNGVRAVAEVTLMRAERLFADAELLRLLRPALAQVGAAARLGQRRG